MAKYRISDLLRDQLKEAWNAHSTEIIALTVGRISTEAAEALDLDIEQEAWVALLAGRMATTLWNREGASAEDYALGVEGLYNNATKD